MAFTGKATYSAGTTQVDQEVGEMITERVQTPEEVVERVGGYLDRPVEIPSGDFGEEPFGENPGEGLERPD